MKGVTPLGDFWMMNRLKQDMKPDELLEKPKKGDLKKAAETIYRFRSLTRVYKSMEAIKNIQMCVKGD